MLKTLIINNQTVTIKLILICKLKIRRRVRCHHKNGFAVKMHVHSTVIVLGTIIYSSRSRIFSKTMQILHCSSNNNKLSS